MSQYVTKIQIDANGDYFVVLPDQLLNEAGFAIGDELEWCTEMFWCDIIMDYRTQVILRRPSE
jgi:hypothetical protein